MAFETGTSTDVGNLLSLLKTFAQSIGWTVTDWSGGTGYIFESSTTGGSFFVYTTSGPGIRVKGCLGTAGFGPNTPTTVWSECNLMGSNFPAYYFFGTMQYLHVAVEISTDVYRHFVIGTLNKAGSYTGGHYMDATYHEMTATPYNDATQGYLNSNTNFPESPRHHYLFDTASYVFTGSSGGLPNSVGQLRVDTNGLTNNFMSQADVNNVIGTNRYTGCNRAGGLVRPLFLESPSDYNQRAVLAPIYLNVYRTGSLLSPAGVVPDLRLVNMQNFDPGSILTIGSDQWYIFPNTQKTTNHNVTGSYVPASGYYGYAYKKVT